MCKTLLAALTSLSLAGLLIGCAKPITVPIDPRLTRDCAYPELRGDTWRDLADAYAERGVALQECTDRMRAIREQ